ncbi:MAG: NAD(P)/FAD-dependent oxidoreductase [Nitriliruptorales bacterium]|nr:NAD(P)/FAD-dependent oxidoreductase [Nitriliruptorales bacterium]
MAGRRPRVVVVGGGFGGLAVARELRGVPVDVLLVDQDNYHLFQPLLYQVATAGLEPADIAYALRGILRRIPNAHFFMAEVVGVDWDASCLLTAAGEKIPFDHLVLAAGATTATFGVPGAAEHAFALKDLRHAVALRSHLLEQFERCAAHPELIDEGLLTVVIVGGGPTGVEMAGALRELFTKVLAKDFPALEVWRARVMLVEMADSVLTAFHRSLQRDAARALKVRRVELRLGTSVSRVTPERVELSDGSHIPARTVLWAAGVRANSLADRLDVPQGRGGRIVVGPDLSVPGRPQIWVVGDLGAAKDVEGQLLPQLAPVAMQGGRHVARSIRRRLEGRPTERFRYVDKGIMATIGRRAAVAQLSFGLCLTGSLAWLAWLFLHLVILIGFRNRLSVLLNWTWNYLTWDRAARLILGPNVRDRSAEPSAPSRSPAADRTTST